MNNITMKFIVPHQWWMKRVVHIFRPVAWNHALNAVKKQHKQKLAQNNKKLQVTMERISNQKIKSTSEFSKD